VCVCDMQSESVRESPAFRGKRPTVSTSAPLRLAELAVQILRAVGEQYLVGQRMRVLRVVIEFTRVVEDATEVQRPNSDRLLCTRKAATRTGATAVCPS
jgi:hypothetical protein